MAEQLPLDEARAERGQADRDVRTVSTPAVPMDGPGDQLLAGPALAGDQDGDVRRRDQGDLLEQLLHGRPTCRSAPRARSRRMSRRPTPARALCVSRARLMTAVAWSRSKGLTR